MTIGTEGDGDDNDDGNADDDDDDDDDCKGFGEAVVSAWNRTLRTALALVVVDVFVVGVVVVGVEVI